MRPHRVCAQPAGNGGAWTSRHSLLVGGDGDRVLPVRETTPAREDGRQRRVAVLTVSPSFAKLAFVYSVGRGPVNSFHQTLGIFDANYEDQSFRSLARLFDDTSLGRHAHARDARAADRGGPGRRFQAPVDVPDRLRPGRRARLHRCGHPRAPRERRRPADDDRHPSLPRGPLRRRHPRAARVSRSRRTSSSRSSTPSSSGRSP